MWNHDISAAPRDGTHVILALQNKTTIRSYWCKPLHDPEHWCMLSHKNEPVAWMLWPDHPNTNPEAKASVDNAATIAPETATAGREMRVGAAPRGSVPATSEGGRDSVERHARISQATATETMGGLPVAAASGTAEGTGRTHAYTRTGMHGTPHGSGVTGGESAATNTKTDAAISRPGIAALGRPEIENRSDQEGSESESSGGMQDEIAIHPATNPQAETSRQTSPVVETESASGGAGASKVVCPALIDDVGGL